MQVFGASDVMAVPPKAAVAAMAEMLRSHEAGRLESPARVSLPFSGFRVLLGAAGEHAAGYGLRVSSVGATALEHVTVLYRPDGAVQAVIVGNELGALRTGALAAVATDLLAAPGPLRVGVLGSGRNAYAQMWALRAVRAVASLRVHSPTASHRATFAARLADELDLPAESVEHPQAALDGAELVICCTRSATPAFDADWVAPGAHVVTVGPKSTTAHEVPSDLLERVRLAVSEAPEELAAPVTDLGGVPIVRLGELLAGRRAHLGGDGDVTMFLVAGFGGADVAFARAVAAHAEGRAR